MHQIQKTTNVQKQTFNAAIEKTTVSICPHDTILFQGNQIILFSVLTSNSNRGQQL